MRCNWAQKSRSCKRERDRSVHHVVEIEDLSYTVTARYIPMNENAASGLRSIDLDPVKGCSCRKDKITRNGQPEEIGTSSTGITRTRRARINRDINDFIAKALKSIHYVKACDSKSFSAPSLWHNHSSDRRSTRIAFGQQIKARSQILVGTLVLARKKAPRMIKLSMVVHSCCIGALQAVRDFRERKNEQGHS